MTNREYKLRLRDAIMNRGIYSAPAGTSEIITRCPFCGDSTNPRKGHLYIKIDPDTDDGIMYNCFKCPAGGYMTPEVLEMLGVTDDDLKSSLTTVQSKSTRGKDISVSNSINNVVLPEIVLSNKTDYVSERLGINFSIEDFRKLRCIPSFRDFCYANKFTGSDLTCEPYAAINFERNYVGFLSSDKNTIFFRDITGKQKIRWYKYKITNKKLPRTTYTIETEIDIMSKESIIVNLSEGVMDAIGIAYHFGYNRMNCLNRAVGSKSYKSAILNLIDLGLVGSNVTLNIFSDNDGTYDTSYDFYKKVLKGYKNLFGRINVVYNIKGKDCGVPKNQIELYSRKI